MKIKATIREYHHLKDFYVETLPQAMTIRGEIRVLHPAPIPSQPVQPIKIYHVGMTAILGILFSTGLAYVFAYLNVRTFFPPQEMNGNQDSIDPVGLTEGDDPPPEVKSSGNPHDPVSSSRRKWNPFKATMRYLITTVSGITLALAVFYLLRKVGY